MTAPTLKTSPQQIYIVILALAVLMVTLGIQHPIRVQGQPSANTLIVATEPLGDTLEPDIWSGFGTIIALDNIGEGLVRSNFNSSEPQPGLAESWSVSDDGLSYTFVLRKNLTFHDGTTLDSKAVVRSFMRYVDEKDPSHPKGYMHFGHASGNIAAIDAVDALTVKFTLKSPDASFLYRLSRPSTYLQSPTALDKFGVDAGKNLVMAGPYKLEKLEAGNEVVLSAFDGYWAGKPKIETLILRGYADETTILSVLQAGEVNFTTAAPLLSVPLFSDLPTIRVEFGPPLVNVFLGINVKDATLSNLELRKALNFAIDRRKFIDVGLNGFAEIPASILTPLDLGFDSTARSLSTYDPALAKKHLEQSGLKLPLELTLTVESARFWPQVAEVVKADLEALGLTVTLKPLDSGSFWNTITAGDFQMSISQRSTFLPDPDDKALILGSGLVAGAYGLDALPSASKMDKLLADGLKEQDREKRISIYREIQALALQELPYIYLAYLTPPVFMASNLRGVDIGAAAAGRATFRDAWFEN